MFTSVFGCSITLKARFLEERKEVNTVVYQRYTEDRRLDFSEFEEILFSNQKNKYDRLKHELEQENDVPLHRSLLLRNCMYLFKKLKYDSMVKSGIINSEGESYIDRNKTIARKWKDHSLSK